MKVLAPEKVQQERLERLGNVDINRLSLTSKIPTGALSDRKDPIVFLRGSEHQNDNAVLAHELGHVVGGHRSKTTNYNEARPMSISAKESWAFYNRNRYMDERPNNNKTLREILWTNQNYNGNYIRPKTTDPAWRREDLHKLSSSENYADLQGLRQLLYENKYTNEFGANIDAETLRKAAADKKVSNHLIYKRLLKGFGKERIVQLNNLIAIRTPVSSNIT